MTSQGPCNIIEKKGEQKWIVGGLWETWGRRQRCCLSRKISLPLRSQVIR